MERITAKTSLFGAALALVAVMLASPPVRGQYESFFGGESWEYHIDYMMTCYTEDYDPNVFSTCCATFSFLFHHDDTVAIGDYSYYYHYHPYDNIKHVCLREDTANGRLYARYDTVADADEFLLCDLSLSVGDTFVLPEGIWSVGGDKIMVVDSITYVSGKKVIHLTLQNGHDFFFATSNVSWMEEYNISLRFMEGIGPIFGIYPTSAVSFEPHLGLLLCMHKDDTLCYMTHEALGCEQYGAGMPEYPQSFLRVSPNPTSGKVTLAFVTEEEISGQVVVRDMAGRVHTLLSVAGNYNVLDLSSLPQGIYMLTFIDDKNRFVTKKLIKH